MKFNFRHSFAFKLSLYIITSIVLIFIAVLVYNFILLKEVILQDNRNNIENLEKATFNRVEKVLASAAEAVQTTAGILESTNLKKDEIESIIRRLVIDNKEIYGSTIAFAPHMFSPETASFAPYYCRDGNKPLRYVNLADRAYNYLNKEWYLSASQSGSPAWSEPYFDKGGGDSLMVTFSKPFYRKENNKQVFCGVVTCDIQLDWLEKMVSEIRIFKKGYAFILSSKGIFIAHPNKDYYKTQQSFFSLSEKYNSPEEKLIGEKMTSGNTGSVRYYSLTLKQMAYLFFLPLPSAGWSLGIVIPEHELFSRLNMITTELLTIGLFGYLFTLGLILYLSTRATVPLKRLAQAAFKIGHGDLQANLPPIKSADEIGILNTSFKNMQDNLIEYIEKLHETAKDLTITQEITIECMASVAEFRDPETGFHIRRTQIYAKELAIYLKNHPRFKNFLDEETIHMIYLSAPLHDVGKVAIPDNILLKQGKLTEEEFKIMKNHPLFGRDAIAEAEKKLKKRSFLRFAKDIAGSHHEKFDGTGYPLGLKGDEIPIPGRIMALADVYDALVTKRVYKPGFSHDKAKQIIIEGRGTHFDPDIVDAFLALEETFKTISAELADKADPLLDHSIENMQMKS